MSLSSLFFSFFSFAFSPRLPSLPPSILFLYTHDQECLLFKTTTITEAAIAKTATSTTTQQGRRRRNRYFHISLSLESLHLTFQRSLPSLLCSQLMLFLVYTYTSPLSFPPTLSASVRMAAVFLFTRQGEGVKEINRRGDRSRRKY